MDVALISSPVDEALTKLEEYLTSPMTPADTEYQRIAQAYQQLAKGTPLIVLSDVIANAPRDAQDRPRLAIARADQRQIRYARHRNWTVECFQSVNHRARKPVSAGLEFQIPVSRPYQPPPVESWMISGFSLVPIVPPSVRRRKGHPRALHTHFVLWEVEAWADRELGANPDRDPYLLQRIADDLFAVVGEWDLTDVERAIMRDWALRR